MIDERLTRWFREENGFELEPNLVVLALMGSHSHGTYIAPEDPDAVDDVDLMGFVVPPLEYHIGLLRWEHWTVQRDELDVVLYSLDKAMRLLLRGNPNIVGLLWLREEHYVHRHPAFERLRGQRGIFSARNIAASFGGYAAGQLQRMEAFDLGLMDDYERLSAQIRPHGRLAEVVEADPARLRGLARDWDVPLAMLEDFRRLHRSHFSGYMGAKRKSMVRRYGYDVKNAAHLVRLLRMGLEFVETGRLEVYRTADAGELMTIKRGGWTLEQVKAEAHRLSARLGAAAADSPLPERPDADAAHALLVDLHQSFLAVDRATGRTRT